MITQVINADLAKENRILYVSTNTNVYKYTLTNISNGSVNNDVSNIIIGNGWESTPLISSFVFKSMKGHPSNYWSTFFLTPTNKLYRFYSVNGSDTSNNEDTQANIFLTTKIAWHTMKIYLLLVVMEQLPLLYIFYTLLLPNSHI